MNQRPFVILSALLVAVVLLYLFFPNPTWWADELELQIVQSIKLPVIVTSILIGAALCVSSATLQILLRNPLADPGLIGITSGASLFAACLILTGGLGVFAGMFETHITSQYMLSVACFAGALCSAFLILKLARRLLHAQSAIILIGIAISTISGALIGWLYLAAPPELIKDMTFWLMGSLHNTDNAMIFAVAPILLVGIWVLCRDANKLNLLYLDSTAAQAQGLNVNAFEQRILVVSALLVGVCVSVAGSIAFLGLLVPHFTRAIFGHDNRIVLIASSIIGASILMFTALVNELAFDSLVPVSMMTATIGGPLFIYVLLKQKVISTGAH